MARIYFRGYIENGDSVRSAEEIEKGIQDKFMPADVTIETVDVDRCAYCDKFGDTCFFGLPKDQSEECEDFKDIDGLKWSVHTAFEESD